MSELSYMTDALYEGLIIRSIGGLYTVACGEELIDCRARGKFRLDDIKPMVGDRVRILRPEVGEAVIREVCARKNSLIRPAVANIGTLVVIASEAPPVTQPFLIDRVSAIAGHKGIDLIVCVNKCDIKRGDTLYETYQRAGFRVIRTSAATGEGVEELRSVMQEGIFVLTGNSGVGKSSLLNKIDPAWSATVGALSERIGRGRQTTRHVELYQLPTGAYLADTPGFQSFDIERMDLVLKDDLAHAFREFAAYIPLCRYADCHHIKEQGCAVREAVAAGNISKSRYESYATLYESMKDIHEWELKKLGNRI